jgi:hypothetical protein
MQLVYSVCHTSETVQFFSGGTSVERVGTAETNESGGTGSVASRRDRGGGWRGVCVPSSRERWSHLIRTYCAAVRQDDIGTEPWGLLQHPVECRSRWNAGSCYELLAECAVR